MQVGTFGVTQDYTYDALDRLMTATEGDRDSNNKGWAETEGFDKWGNRWMSGSIGRLQSHRG